MAKQLANPSVKGASRKRAAPYLERYPALHTTCPAGMPSNIASSPQSAMSVERFCALEIERTQALVAGNMEVANRLHAPEYQLITPAGKSFSRHSYLEAIASGALRYQSWECGPMEVRLSPGMAIVRYQARLRFPSGSRVTCWHTDSYEPRLGQWQAIWSQATAIAQPNPVREQSAG